MRLIECYVENFGKLSQYTYRFNSGMNVIYAENGYGKTTLSVFIRSMFYGLNAERKQSLDENDRKKYTPWQGGRYGGSLTFEADGKIYRIERSFGSKAAEDIFRLVDAASGESSHDYTENIGFELFDIDAAGFERTLFLSEKSTSGAIVNDSIAAKLSDLVGTTGDVGAVSAALSRLEERRKYYQKRGNTGEIAALKQKISECETAEANLERRRLEFEKKEAMLSSIESEIKALEDESASARDRLQKHKNAQENESYREQYGKMRESVEAARKEYGELELFFANGAPTQQEIDEARDAARDAAALRESLKEYESAELTELRAFFASPTDFSEIEGIKKAERERRTLDAERAAIKTNLDFAEATLKEELGGRIPDRNELEQLSLAGGGKTGYAIAAALLILGVIGAILGFAVTPLILIAAIPMIAIGTAIGYITYARTSRTRALAARLSLRSTDPTYIGSLTGRVYDHEIMKARELERISMLADKVSSYGQSVDAFIARYPHKESDRERAIALIEEKHSRYYALLDIAKHTSVARAGLDLKIGVLEAKVRNFSEKYKSDAENPYEDVRAKLNAYLYERRTLAMREAELVEFARLHAIGEASEHASLLLSEGERIKLSEYVENARAHIIALRKEHALLESEYNTELSDVERIDEVRAVRAALSEKLGTYLDNLSVITATAAMLNEASEAMTSRYIGGTKSRFEHYVKEIGELGSDYSMGTDFVIKKHDKGETRSEESYSKGTRDMHAFALRLALADSLWGGKSPIVILDDPFSTLDNVKLEHAKALVKALAKEKQVIYFTCSRERMI